MAGRIVRTRFRGRARNRPGREHASSKQQSLGRRRNPSPNPTLNAIKATKQPLNQYPGAAVLLADDDLPNRTVVHAILAKFGIQADLASDGSQAVEAGKAKRYDLIFMDCMMPGLDGYGATRAIRDIASPSARSPIIALTANADDDERKRCLAAGMTDHLAKPLRARALAAALERWLSPLRDAGPPSPATDPGQGETADSLFNPAALSEMFSGDPDTVHSLITEFGDTLPKSLAQLDAAISADDDFTKARLQAHNLRGSASNFGAKSLSAIAEQLEDAAVARDPAAVRALYAELRSVAEATLARVQAVLDKADNSKS